MWGQAQYWPVESKARQAAKVLSGKGRATQGREQPLPAGLGSGRDQAQRRPARSKAHQAAKASPGKGRATQSLPDEARVGPGAHLMGPAQRRPARSKAHQAAKGVARQGPNSAEVAAPQRRLHSR